MCLSPDQMTSTQLENMAQYYRNAAEDFDSNYYRTQAEKLEALLKERADNGTYDVVPEVTPRHIH